MKTTVGQILVNSVLPQPLRDYTRRLDKKTVKELFDRIAKQYPDDYARILKRLNDIGRLVATYHGRSTSVGIDDLKLPVELQVEMDRIRRHVQKIVETTPPSKRTEAVVAYLSKVADDLRKKNLESGLKEGNAFAQQIASGSRGNPTQFASLRLGKFIVVDHKGRPMPIPILHGFGEGLTPAEQWANSYGSRMGMVVLQESTPIAGFMGKQLALAAHRLYVTEKDCGSSGIDVSTEDKDTIGAVLAKPYGPFPAGTVITPKILNRLKKSYKEITVRSPITCQSDHGVCQKCAGIREGDYPPIGSHIGVTAVNALAEPIAQSQICLHEDTLVLMGDWTAKPIKDIVPGDMVMAATKEGKYFPTEVIALHDNGLQSCQKYWFQLGNRGQSQAHVVSVISTPQHNYAITYLSRDGSGVRRYEIKPIEAAKPYHSFVMANQCKYAGKSIDHANVFGILMASAIARYKVLIVNLKGISNVVRKQIVTELEEAGLRFTVTGSNTIIFIPIDENPIVGDIYDALIDERTISFRDWGFDSLCYFVRNVTLVAAHIDVAHNRVVYQFKDTVPYQFVTEFAWVLRHRMGIAARAVRYVLPKQIEKRAVVSDAYSVRTLLHLISLVGEQEAKRVRVLNQLDGDRPAAPAFQLVGHKPAGYCHTYDIEIDTPDHLFVLGNGLIVSNSAKHTAGAMGSTSAISGLSGIKQMVDVPANFPLAATLSEAEGRVDKIVKNPQGGWTVTINGVDHYVAPDRKLLVKIGDTVDEGDVLTDGVPNPADVARLKGIGAARRYFVDQFTRVLRDSGVKAHRRNVELLARGLINHVRITHESPHFPYAPGDIVEYDTLARRWVPRKDSVTTQPSNSVKGMYLEQPVLEYSIGTKLTKSVIQRLKQKGIKSVIVNANPPPFKPEMRRALESTMHSDDWMVRLGGFHLQKGLLDAAQTGSVSHLKGDSYIPALAKGVGFSNYQNLGDALRELTVK